MDNRARRKVLKTVIVGPSNVGKTAIMLRYTAGKFCQPSSTIGVDFKFKELTLQNTRIMLQIWDMAGQERFMSAMKNYYRGASICIFVCDLTDETSLDAVEFWLNEFRHSLNMTEEDFSKFPVLLLGNKCDLVDKRQITPHTIDNFCRKHGVKKFIETSAVDDTGIEEAFLYGATEAYNREEAMRPCNEDDVLTLHNQECTPARHSGESWFSGWCTF